MNWFKIGKGVRQDCKLSPCLFSLYAEYIMQNARLDDLQAEIKIAGRNINSLRFRVVLSAYLRLLIFLLAILIPACASSSLVFLMIYSAYKLNKQSDNIQFFYILLSQFGTSSLFHVQF